MNSIGAPRMSTIVIAVDQGLASFNSGCLLFLVTGIASATTLGYIALCLSTILTAAVVLRSGVLVNISLESGDTQRVSRLASLVASAVLWTSPLLTTGLIVFSSTVTRQLTGAGVLLAVAAPLFLLNDTLRFAAIAQARRGVVLCDGLWTLAGVSLVLMRISGVTDVNAYVAIWTCGLAAGCASLLFVLRGQVILIRLQAVASALASGLRQRSFIHLLTAGAVTPLSMLLYFSLVTAALGTATLGVLTAVGTVFVPLSVIMSAIPLVLSQPGVRIHLAPSWRFTTVVLASTGMAVLGWWALVEVTIGIWGTAILGSMALDVAAVLPVAALSYWMWMAHGTFGATLAVIGLARSLARIAVPLSTFRVVAGTAVAFLWGSVQALLVTDVLLYGLGVSADLTALQVAAQPVRTARRPHSRRGRRARKPNNGGVS